ncbi:hypothetical protein GQ42DRAFT_158771 [Ramicandelaber brevisporus]|nr:hypothetical protein GQ42DRAFT_158771 [Ramicandelaber brevisporus]
MAPRTLPAVSILHSPFFILHSPFSILHSPFSILHSPFCVFYTLVGLALSVGTSKFVFNNRAHCYFLLNSKTQCYFLLDNKCYVDWREFAPVDVGVRIQVAWNLF